MQLLGLCVALILCCCWVPLALGSDSQYTDLSSLGSVDTVTYKGSKLRVYNVDGVRVAEPRITFARSCNRIKYQYLYRRYQLAIPLHIETNTLRSTRRGAKVGRVTLTELRLKISKALTRRESGYRVMAEMMKGGYAWVLILCHSYIQCQQVRDFIDANPGALASAVKFVPIGRIGGGHPVKFGTISSANKLSRVNCNRGRWVVFQKRVDGSLSFVQTWSTYVRGFGNPSSNYWMGLDRLFAMTVTSQKNGYADSSRCRLRIETQDFRGRNYWGEYKLFEVLGPRDYYKLRVGKMVRGSKINLLYHNGMKFSTYDRDHDKTSKSCSKLFGYGGWWYKGCHGVNLNGAYSTDKSIVSHPNYDSVHYAGKYIPMKRTLMKFRCD